MNSLSLSPRMDLFKLAFPKDFLSKEIEEKYTKLLNKNSNVLFTPIDYLNESIQSVSLPGMSDINIVQEQHGNNARSLMHTGKQMDIRPKHDITYTSTASPLEMIGHELKVTFRMNQGLYNYFMLYEIAFNSVCDPYYSPMIDVLRLEILNEEGLIISTIKFFDVFIDGIDGLDFSFAKIERDTGTFDVTFKFNNIDFEFLKNSESDNEKLI